MHSVENSRHRQGERAILVLIQNSSNNSWEQNFSRSEFTSLAQAAGVQVCHDYPCKVRTPNPRTLIGRGKMQELAECIEEHQADVALFDTELSPSQERNLEKSLCCRVIGRTGVILDIFAQRATTYEGRLQVELAQLQHLSTRLVRGWTHLERQRGGIGVRGPGESQLETDRRLLGKRMIQLRGRIERINKTRETGRRARQRSELALVALVGYTNAGKSTLFNRLSHDSASVADRLFVTLDPKLRKVRCADGLTMILADTVGFVSNLPHELVDAFGATLAETRKADVLLHVVDASSDYADDMYSSVNQTLDAIGVSNTPQLTVYNQIDRIGERPRIEYFPDGRACAVWLSAQSGEGVALLDEALRSRLEHRWIRKQVQLKGDMGAARAWLYANNAVESEDVDERGMLSVQVSMPTLRWQQFQRLYSLES